jgi:hypothetical protein
MALNYEGIGKPLAEIVDKNNKDSKKNKRVSMAEDFELDKVKNPLTQINLQPNEFFQQIPDDVSPKINQRKILYTSGASGSGKTYYSADYIKKYVKQNPKNRIILFSSLDEDDTLDKIKQIKRVKVKQPGFVDEEFNIDMFKDTLVIFDDTDCIKDKKIIKQISSIADIVLQTGRHTNTSMIFTSHLSCAGASTKMILNESHSIIFFPSAMTPHSLKYLCMTYVGLDSKQVDLIKKEKSRWICSFKSCPKVLMTINKMCFVRDYGDKQMEPINELSGGCNAVENSGKIKCEGCGAMIRADNKRRHEKTPRHLNSLR